jgi:hypothetical protein
VYSHPAGLAIGSKKWLIDFMHWIFYSRTN